MHIPRQIFSNVLLVFGLCFASIQAEEINRTDTYATSVLSITETVKETLMTESTSTYPPTNIVTALTTEPNQVHSESTQSYQISTNLDESTAGTTVQNVIGTEQTTPSSVFERTTAEQTTMAVKTTTITVTESTTSLPTTSLYETTGGITTADLTSLPPVHHEHEPTTTTDAVTTELTEATTLQQTRDRTESSTSITSTAVEATTSAYVTTSISTTKTLTFTSQYIHGGPEPHHSTSGEGINFTPSTTVGHASETIPFHQTQGFIIIVCVSIVCMLFVCLLLCILCRKKKNTSGKFGPGYMNGQNAKKKKGVEKDAWAGPVHLEAGERVECDGEVQGAPESANGNRDGDDVVLSTFAPFETDDTSNGGVGGEGTKEAKKWEEQEPLLYIDEDEDKITERNNEEKPASDEKTFSGEAFCLTTAV
nr:mucin-2 [Misgurnus anguillicaudatus]